MNNNFEHTAEQAAAFQKLWMQSASKMLQATLGVAPNTDPESLRQMRSGVFQALAQSWEEFMRSPQFLDSMKQGMENAVTFRKMSGEFLAKMRNEMQAPSRDDVDTIMLAIRHLETRLLDRIEAISAQIDVLKPQSQKRQATQAHRTRRRTSSSFKRRPEQKREEAP
jgi:hypothetical protein